MRRRASPITEASRKLSHTAKAVGNILAGSIQLPEDLPQSEKDLKEKVGDSMQATIEPALAQRPRYLTRGSEKKTRPLEITAKVKSSDYSSGRKFSARHSVFDVMKSLQRIIAKAVYSRSPVVCGFSPFNETLVDGQNFVN